MYIKKLILDGYIKRNFSKMYTLCFGNVNWRSGSSLDIMSEKFIDYSKMIDDAMHVIVINALKYVKKNGLPNKHHFFIQLGIFLDHAVFIQSAIVITRF